MQRHTLKSIHDAVELIRAGAIGDVTEAHAWVGGSRGMPDMPKATTPVPATLKWDLWLGGAPERPHSPDFAPYKWRFWWDFGLRRGGKLGLPHPGISVPALGWTYPTKVSATGPDVDAQRMPKSMHSTMEFPAVGGRCAVTGCTGTTAAIRN